MEKKPEKAINNKSIQVPKSLIVLFKSLQIISPKKATQLAIKTLYTPINYPTPENEIPYKHSMPLHRELVGEKRITTYVNGKKPFKTLLIHGWSGRATQFLEIGPALTKANLSYISFTAPAHGSSNAKQTNVTEFIETIAYLMERHGPFDSIIAHSIGGVAALNTALRFPEIKKVVTIGTPATIQNTIDDFCKTLNLNNKVKAGIEKHIRANINPNYEELSAANVASKIQTKGLIIQDQNDSDVPPENAKQIHENWKNSELLITEGLGHRKILTDPKVVAKIIEFIQN